MTVKLCPNCNERYVIMPNTGDFVHDCSISSSNALRQEDVVVTGDWEDYTGSGETNPAEIVVQGAANKFQGTEAGILGENQEEFTARGNRSSTRRQRKHLHYIEKGETLYETNK